MRASEQWDNDWHWLPPCAAAAKCLVAERQSFGIGVFSPPQTWPTYERKGPCWWLVNVHMGTVRAFGLAGALTVECLAGHFRFWRNLRLSKTGGRGVCLSVLLVIVFTQAPTEMIHPN